MYRAKLVGALLLLLFVLASLAVTTVQAEDEVKVECVFVLKYDKTWIPRITFSPNGKQLAVASAETVKIWDTTAYKEVATLKVNTHWVSQMVFSPDGKRLAILSSLHGVGELWNATSAKRIRTLNSLKGNYVGAIGFHPDGKRLVMLVRPTRSRDTTVVEMDPVADRVVRSLVFRRDIPVNPVVPQPLRATGGYGEILGANAKSVVWIESKNQKSTGPKQQVKVMDLSTRRVVHSHVIPVPTVIMDMAVSPDGKQLACTGNASLVLLDLSSGKEVVVGKRHNASLSAVVFSPDGKRVASSFADKTVDVWDLALEKELCTLKGDDVPTLSLAFSPDGGRLAGLCADSTVRVWALPQAKDSSSSKSKSPDTPSPPASKSGSPQPAPSKP